MYKRMRKRNQKMRALGIQTHKNRGMLYRIRFRTEWRKRNYTALKTDTDVDGLQR